MGMRNGAAEANLESSLAGIRSAVERSGHQQTDDAKAAKQEARRLKRALRELSDSVLVFLHWMDNTVGPNKEIPRELSTKLGKACTFLDIQNDGARRFHLGLSITAEGKKKAAEDLRKLGAL